MNTPGELAGSGSIKNWLHKALKEPEVDLFSSCWKKRLSEKTFQNSSLIQKHFNLCIYHTLFK